MRPVEESSDPRGLMRWAVIAACAIPLSACGSAGVDGTYLADDGEGTRVTLTLDGGTAQFWQGDTDSAPVRGVYRIDGPNVVLDLGGVEMHLTASDRCLAPVEHPDQAICKN